MVSKIMCLCGADTSVKDVNPLNPLSEKVRSRLYSEIRESIHDDSITSIILFGGGPHFSAGADIT